MAQDHVFDKVPPGFRRGNAAGVLIPRDSKRGHTTKQLRQENAALQQQLAEMAERHAAMEERLAALESMGPPQDAGSGKSRKKRSDA